MMNQPAEILRKSQLKKVSQAKNALGRFALGVSNLKAFG
jgi:hypothetical protein